METRLSYPSDLTDAEWARIARFIPDPGPNDRAVVDALLYRQATGCPWDYLPQDLPRWQTVYWCDRFWCRGGRIERTLAALRGERTGPGEPTVTPRRLARARRFRGRPESARR